MDIVCGITFAVPENSIYFLLYLVALLIVSYRWIKTIGVIHFLGKSIQGHIFLHNIRVWRVTLKNILWALGLLFLFIALLHPSWNQKEETVTQEGRDLFIALDISRSMLAQDILPNRLEFAKSKIKSFVQSLETDRVGLILFSGSSFVQCPLTRDKSAFYMFLNQIDVETIASGTTALDQAIAQAIQAFSNNPEQKNKLLVIFTDGEDFSSNLATLKQQAQQQGLTIFTIGVGTAQGAPIPTFDSQGKPSGHLKDKKGSVVISQLNEGILKTLAHDVGGIYIPLSHERTQSNNDLQQLITLIQQKEKEKIEERKFSQYQQQYHWFLLISLILLGFEWLL